MTQKLFDIIAVIGLLIIFLVGIGSVICIFKDMIILRYILIGIDIIIFIIWCRFLNYGVDKGYFN